MDDPEISDGASENEYSDHEPEVEKEDDDNADMAEQNPRTDAEENAKAGESIAPAKPKLDPKDPLRPRRKKARRACFACQRAHLTCGTFVSSMCFVPPSPSHTNAGYYLACHANVSDAIV